MFATKLQRKNFSETDYQSITPTSHLLVVIYMVSKPLSVCIHLSCSPLCSMCLFLSVPSVVRHFCYRRCNVAHRSFISRGPSIHKMCFPILHLNVCAQTVSPSHFVSIFSPTYIQSNPLPFRESEKTFP